MPKTKKRQKGSNLEEARHHLGMAKKQLHDAQVHSWEPVEPDECVTMAFYGFENALVSAAYAVGKGWKPNHYAKAELAEKLFKSGKLSIDISERLLELNDARKDISYGETGEDLSGIDLEELVTELENFIEEVESLIDTAEDEA